MDQLSSQIAILTPVAAGLVWIGSGVWRIAKWTERHDSRVQAIETWRTGTDKRLDVLEADVTMIKVDVAGIKAKM